jgi:saccharopine dehydrogenase-like NADP-dependent oxidoreductase
MGTSLTYYQGYIAKFTFMDTLWMLDKQHDDMGTNVFMSDSLSELFCTFTSVSD